MRKTITNLILSAIIFFSGDLIAQNTNNWCGTDQYLQERMNDPEFAKSIEKHNKIFQNITTEKSGTKLIVPVVVHIMHNCYGGNISNAQVRDGIRVLNEDYNRINSDTTFPRSLFLAQGGSMNIEFRLAQIDENGNCTDGIERIEDDRTLQADDPMKTASIWDYSKYFNIWLVEEIDGSGGGSRILGRAVFPSDPQAPNVYGFLNVNDEWGTIGTASGSNGRTATHEIGHNFGLYHIFESFAGNNCNASTCQNAGDFICDTPPQSGQSYNCSTTLNTCTNDATGGTGSNPNPYSTDMKDMIENYMSYNSCQNMFTNGQAAVMQSSINTYGYLTNLVSPANNIATGTNDGYVAQICAPEPNFCASAYQVCEGTQINFFDRSYNGEIDSSWVYTWDFGDGSPTSNTASHVYTTGGIFNVTLSITNSAGTNSITKNNYIEVIPNSGGFSNYMFEGIENSTFPTHPTNSILDWKIENESSSTWERTTTASTQGSASARIKCFGIPSGKKHSLISPPIDLSSFGSCGTRSLEFDIAYAQRTSATSDQLKVYVSINCGETWIPRYAKTGSALSSTGSYVTTAFTPNANQWTRHTVNLNTFAQNPGVLVKIELTSGLGNYLYLDSIEIQSCPTGIDKDITSTENINVYPNPFSNDFNMSIDLVETENVKVKILDMTGKEVITNSLVLGAGHHDIKLSDKTSMLTKGMYFIQLSNNKGVIYNSKIIKE